MKESFVVIILTLTRPAGRLSDVLLYLHNNVHANAT